MSLLFESIRVANGKYENLVYHEQRMRRSLKELCGHDEFFDLENYLNRIPVPAGALYKCKLIYDEQTRSVELTEYHPRSIKSLKVVEHDRINYEFKYVNRKTLDDLFSQRGECDDILIIRDGIVTDTSYANVAFRKGDEWLTPYEPLLRGTMRQQLLEYNKIQEAEITLDEIKKFDAIKLFNAMILFDSDEINTKNIVL